MDLEPQEADINLKHYIEVIQRRRWIILSIWVIVVLGVTVSTLTTKSIYQAEAMVDIEKERGSFGSTYAESVMVESRNEDYYQTQYKLLQSDSLTQKVYDQLHLENSPEFAPPFGLEKLHQAISVAPIPRSRLVYVRAMSGDPALAARIANTLSESFVSENLQNQMFISKDVLQMLQLQSSEKDTQHLYESLPAVVNNGLISSLKSELSKLQSDAAEKSQSLTPRHPVMMSLNSHMDAVKKQIQAESDRVVRSLKTELSGQLQGNNVRIIDHATVPNIPVYPKKKRNLLMGVIGGFLLGFAVAIIIELLDQTIRTQEDVERKLGLSFLGIVPFVNVPTEHVYKDLISPEASLTSESFRNLRTMIDFANVSEKTNAFLVSSSVQDEGKTYISSNLAVGFAHLGENVLLISGDLRRPKVHKSFQVSSQRGLSDFLAKGASVDELAELVQETGVPHLKILPCGPTPPNPSELLNTPRLGAAVAWARAHFDRVIVDCTPIFPISDTLLWGRHIRSAIYVVRYGKTRVPLVKNACQRLAGAGVKVLGIAVNAAKPSGLTYNSYGYYYQQYYHDYQQPSTSKVG